MDLNEQLRRDEGVRYRPYQDSLGIWTVGVGHKLLSTDDFIYPLTDDNVDALLESDVAKVMSQLAGVCSWFPHLDDVRKGAVVNWAFNIGVHGVLLFVQAGKAIAAGDWQTAHDQMLASEWATQVGARATRLATQILTGVWQ